MNDMTKKTVHKTEHFKNQASEQATQSDCFIDI